jgi:hypothetical protein
MDSIGENHPALVKLREWREASTPLGLHLSGPGLNVNFPVTVSEVSESEVRFTWAFSIPPSPLFMFAEGAVLLVLAGASLLPNETSSGMAITPDAPVYILRDAYVCIIRPK